MDEQHQRIVVVAGATGHQGGAVAHHLHGRGFRVRALTRNPEGRSAKALAEEGMEVVRGDFDDAESLARALEGAYGAFGMQTFLEAGTEGEARQGKTFADQAAEAGVEHFVYSSVAGAERDTGIPHFESKWEIEGHIRDLGLPATILRPVWFMDNWAATVGEAILGGILPQPFGPGTSLQQIAVKDIGAFAALAFRDPEEWIGQEIEIAGDQLTMTETAAVFARVLDRPVAYRQVAWNDFESRAGADITAMYRWIESAGFEADLESLRDLHPPLLTFEGFLSAGWAADARALAANARALEGATH